MHLRFWHDLRGAEESRLWNASSSQQQKTERGKGYLELACSWKAKQELGFVAIYVHWDDNC